MHSLDKVRLSVTLTKSSKDAWDQSRIFAIIVAHILTLITSLKIKQEKAQFI